MLKMVLNSNISSLICNLVGVRKDIGSSKTRSWMDFCVIVSGSPFVVEFFNISNQIRVDLAGLFPNQVEG